MARWARRPDWDASTAARLSLGLVFGWFGALKLVPGLSPAEELAGTTISLLTGGVLPPPLGVPLLGAGECLLGLVLLSGRALRPALALLFAHMAGIFAPLVLLPDVVFERFPWVLSLEGQYIVKNLVLVSAGLAVAGAVRRPAVPRRLAGGRRAEARPVRGAVRYRLRGSGERRVVAARRGRVPFAGRERAAAEGRT